MNYFDEATETLPREQLAALQVNKLQAMMTELWGRNGFYTAKWKAAGVSPADIKSLDDLGKLPFTKKSELMDDQAAHGPFGSNLTYPVEAYVRMHQTSGTTGVPLKVMDTDESWDWWGRCWGHVLAGAGVTSSDRLFMAFAFGPFIGFWAAVEGARKIGAVMIPGGGRDSQQRLELMRETGTTVLCCTPTYALRLAEVAHEIGFDIECDSDEGHGACRRTRRQHPGDQGAHRERMEPPSASTMPAPRKSAPIPSSARSSPAAPT